MADTVVVVSNTGEILTVPTTVQNNIVVIGQGPQGLPAPGVPTFIGTTQPVANPPYIWYQKQADGSYKVFVEDGT